MSTGLARDATYTFDHLISAGAMGIKEKKEINNNREIKDDTRKARRFCENTTIKRAVIERPHDKSLPRRRDETRRDEEKQICSENCSALPPPTICEKEEGKERGENKISPLEP